MTAEPIRRFHTGSSLGWRCRGQPTRTSARGNSNAATRGASTLAGVTLVFLGSRVRPTIKTWAWHEVCWDGDMMRALARRTGLVGLVLAIALPAAVTGVTLTARAAGASPTITNYPNPNVISIACGVTTGP